MSLMASLGLDEVEADPNALPDGKWPGVIYKSEYVEVKSKNTYNHVITYQVTEGDRKGAQRQEWFTIGECEHDADGKLVGVKPTMTEQQKPWYKKRLVDLGVPEAEINSFAPADLVGKDVIFGTKKNGNFININFVELRNDVAAALPGQTGGIMGAL